MVELENQRALELAAGDGHQLGCAQAVMQHHRIAERSSHPGRDRHLVGHFPARGNAFIGGRAAGHRAMQGKLDVRPARRDGSILVAPD